MSAAIEALGEAIDSAWDLLPWEEWGLIVEALRGRAPRGRDEASVALRRVRTVSKRKGLEEEIERWVGVVEMNHAWALEEEEGL